MNENKSIGSGAYDAPSRSVVAVQAMMTRCPLTGRRRPLVAVSRRPSVVRRGRSSTWSAATSRRTPRAGRRPCRDQRPTAPTRRRLTTLRATRVATDRTYTSSSDHATCDPCSNRPHLYVVVQPSRRLLHWPDDVQLCSASHLHHHDRRVVFHRPRSPSPRQRPRRTATAAPLHRSVPCSAVYRWSRRLACIGCPVWARGRCRISPPRFLAECCKRQLNQVSFVVLYFRLSTFLFVLSLFICIFLYCFVCQ